MTNRSDWEDSNAVFLSGALEWLRNRLERRANELRPIIDQPTGIDHGAVNPMLSEPRTDLDKASGSGKSKVAKRNVKSGASV